MVAAEVRLFFLSPSPKNVLAVTEEEPVALKSPSFFSVVLEIRVSLLILR